MQQEANWTILIYANGNNELEPEMRQAMHDAEKVGSSATVNVVMQLGRAEYKLVKLIRQDFLSKVDDNWSGVRRYLVGKGSSTLIRNLKRENMADPRNLYDFIKWGMHSYPAKKYMLILGGHGYQFVGMMTDYSKKAPYIMGIPEMVSAIDMAANEMGKKIDILLLDTCYFNSIESIYELGRDENHSVRSVITHILNGAIEGLPYNRIIELVQANSNSLDSNAVIKKIIDDLSFDLVAFQISHQKIMQIKQLFNNAASEYLSKNSNGGNIFNEKVSDELNNSISTISLKMMSLVIHFKRVSQNKSPLIVVASKTTDNLDLIARYNRLGFAQGNCWIRLLSIKHVDAAILHIEQKKNLLPIKMKPGEVYAYISVMNPGMTESQKKAILANLYQYKKWV